VKTSVERRCVWPACCPSWGPWRPMGEDPQGRTAPKGAARPGARARADAPGTTTGGRRTTPSSALATEPRVQGATSRARLPLEAAPPPPPTPPLCSTTWWGPWACVPPSTCASTSSCAATARSSWTALESSTRASTSLPPLSQAWRVAAATCTAAA